MAVTNKYLDPSPGLHASLAVDAVRSSAEFLPKRSLHAGDVHRHRTMAGDGT